ncbi:hypothetical protein RclHR1_06810007 [Rhizophagus clarus]|uniref:Protein kinase domain-containing protein n=1 Tax=Rhizophagus clarus TaxID=94130 RepID=A0A2Z6RTL0_9GLOM|nr:hypothetical protein RclHR1_06810007 [Rhizophagus clarus]
MDLTNTFSENSFNPTPRLKSSPVPILFIPFNRNELKCSHCSDYYSTTVLFHQKYCKNCLFNYIKNYGEATYLDVHTRQCSKTDAKENKNKQEWCENCLVWMYNHTGEEVSQFKQIIPTDFDEYNNKVYKSEKVCKLCKHESISNELELCSNCYQISSGWIESTLTKNFIPILYLPWWDTFDECVACKKSLIFVSDCQKWCLYCNIIYFGCRHCLTTNIIFGITDQSQCIKCKRISYITFNTKGFFKDVNTHSRQIANYVDYINNQIAYYVNHNDKSSNPLDVYNFMSDLYFLMKPLKDWTSNIRITNLENNGNTLGQIMPVIFVSFYGNKRNYLCHYCRSVCSETRLFKQMYCKHCFILYIKYVLCAIKNDYIKSTVINNMELCIGTNNTKCENHESRNSDFYTQNIQEWCDNCSEILQFKQVVTNLTNSKNYYYKTQSSNCYKISSGWVKSAYTKEFISILYLPWWDACDDCITCSRHLDSVTECQKWCMNCFIIYTGCRGCLTTNIIFGITNQSQYYWIENSSQTLPIVFLPFNNNKDKCYYCKRIYSVTLLFKQKYCKNCLFLYIKYTLYKIKNITIVNKLDIHLSTQNIKCDEHKPRNLDFCTQNIQEWCKSCFNILYFNKVIANGGFDGESYETNCKLCGKLICQQISSNDMVFRLCSNCYQISYELVESTSTKESILILCLPWWDTCDQCIACGGGLYFGSDCQKWCSYCVIIYSGCRYCLTTNVIFGFTEETQCKSCKRILDVNIDNIVRKVRIDEEEVTSITINRNYHQIVNYISNPTDKNYNPLGIYNFIKKLNYLSSNLLTSLYSKITKFDAPVPVMFVPFDNNAKECCFCRREYSITLLLGQKYCKICLLWYITNTTNKINLDVNISTNKNNILCNTHKPRNLDFCTQNIQEWCLSCSEILYFNQILGENEKRRNRELTNMKEMCEICGQQLLNFNYDGFTLCSNCYQISSEYVESTLTNNLIPVFYLPWWDGCDHCIACDKFVEFESDCQKWCSYCIIIYSGCRYCLTTNIIFGITDQSRCKKCKRIKKISFITIEPTKIKDKKLNIKSHKQVANYVENCGKNSNPLEIYEFVKELDYCPLKPLIDWITHSQFISIENDENCFDLDIPITFLSFNNNENKCYYCKTEYSETLLSKQKFCKHCLFLYIKYVGDDNKMDVYISTNATNNIECDKHKLRDFFNSQKWCDSCSEILHFNQIVTDHRLDVKDINYCKLCGKLKTTFCSNCYVISSGWIELTSTKKQIPILYLPWWDAHNICIICNQGLKSNADCQKWCSNCFIVYVGCKYCLTTNIIFGITDQSQCYKCKRISLIVIDTKYIIEEWLTLADINAYINYYQIANYKDNIDKNSNPLRVYDFIGKNVTIIKNPLKLKVEWILHSQFTNFKEIAKGGFGTIYKASWEENQYGIVAIKRFSNSRNVSKDFLNEVTFYQRYYDKFKHIIEYYGITQDSITKEHMIVMEYADGGDLHNYLQNNFNNITWKDKLAIILDISKGLNSIHKENFIHRDLHSGNILLKTNPYGQKWKIGDLGLSQPANNVSLNNEIYGVVPYIAPEIFKGVKFSKASDIYSMGMILWELTTGCKPFYNIEHDSEFIYKVIDGKRPNITNDTPEYFADLMKKCWNSDLIKRPSALKIYKAIRISIDDDVNILNQAEELRLELIGLKMLGPEFSEKSHSDYTNRSLSSFITKHSMISFNTRRQRYITKEYEFDINDIQRPSRDSVSNAQHYLNAGPSNT